ncbi:MAG: EamA family transporter [Candidatus Peribacteraceae bacterium]|nr:EamA family transporter [Candidatus Peribacteraceae bacterium]
MWLALQLVATLGWALVTVLDSVLVKHYEKRPYVLMWCQSCFSLPVLLTLLAVSGGAGSWTIPLVLAGMIAFLGDIAFFTILNRIDASVVQIAWAIFAVLLSAISIALFGETWSMSQLAGVILLLGGIAFLSLRGKGFIGPFGFVLLVLLAVLYVPFYATQKAAMRGGTSVLVAFVLPLLARESLCFAVPLLVPSWRSSVIALLRRVRWPFFFVCGSVVILFFVATYLNTWVYDIGPLSLGSVISNVQPFFILLVAWIFWKVLPAFAPRELLTRQAVSVKIVSFLIVFAGLALLALPQ